MITKNQRANRLRRHMNLKRLYEVQLEDAVSDFDKKHLKARIAEIDRDIETTKGDRSEEGDAPLIPAEEAIEPKVLLPVIPKKAEEDAKTSEEPSKRSRKRKVGNPF